MSRVSTVIDLCGRGADLALHEGYAYVASGDAGLQVVNLTRARELFLAQTPDPLSIPFAIRTSLFTRGQGFGQTAIVAAATFASEDVVSVAIGDTR